MTDFAESKPTPIDDKPKGRVFTEARAWCLYEESTGARPPSKEKLVEWIKQQFGIEARVA